LLSASICLAISKPRTVLVPRNATRLLPKLAVYGINATAPGSPLVAFGLAADARVLTRHAGNDGAASEMRAGAVAKRPRMARSLALAVDADDAWRDGSSLRTQGRCARRVAAHAGSLRTQERSADAQKRRTPRRSK
jgi:hypothetical protein